MRQREIEDTDGTRWSCVQAFTGPGGDDGEARLDEDGRCRVVCTPRGGVQSVRLRLPADWVETLGDDDLRAAIRAARED